MPGDRHAVLVDAGYGSELAETERLLRRAGFAPPEIGLLALTHMHCDHAGGAGGLQARYGTTIALHRSEAELVHDRSPDAGDARRLGHPLAPFCVDHPLADGDVIDGHGGPALVVVHLGAQTRGHVAFHLPDLGVLLTGDLLQERDVGWLPPGREAVAAGLAALDRLEATGATRALPGHGPPVPDVAAAIERARRRYSAWLEHPADGVRHAIRRLVVAALQLDPGSGSRRLPAVPVVRACAEALDTAPEVLVSGVIADLVHSGALAEQTGALRPTGPHEPPAAHPYGPLDPATWPEDLVAVAGAWRFP